MVADSECLKILTEILDELPIGSYKVKISHRKLLDALMEIAGVPNEKFRTICSAVDKLDKEPWSKVREEMVIEKGLQPQIADRLGSYVTLDPGNALDFLSFLESEPSFKGNKMAMEAFKELGLLFKYLQALGCLDKFSFDLSLARGLDYYTGVIYEALLLDTDKCGSIASGGRYDNLVGMFSSKDVPAVGISIGIERILAILELGEKKHDKIRASHTEVLICSVGKNLLEARMQLCNQLWHNDIKAEFLYDLNPKPKKQMDYAQKHAIPFLIWIGENEIKAGIVKLKDMDRHEEREIPQTDVVRELRGLLNN